MQEDYIESLGLIGVAARIRRLNDRLMSSGRKVYDKLHLEIEPNWHLILLLLEEKEQLSVTEIAAILKLSHPAIIKITGRMLERDYLVSRRDKGDHRKQLLSLSPEAREKLPGFKKKWELIASVHSEYYSETLMLEIARLEQSLDEKSIEQRVFEKQTGKVEFWKATVEDIPHIQSLARKIWPDTFSGNMEEDQIEYMLEMQYDSQSLYDQMVSRNHIYLLVVNNNRIVGYASYELNYRNSTQMMIHKAYMLPETQGRGIGTKLFDFLARTGLDCGQDFLRLNVYYRNSVAIRFYGKYGFKIEGKEEKDIGNDFIVQDYVMLKSII